MPQTILIADDDTELCELLREYLGQEGFEVRLAYDGEQALVESRRPGLDVMVLDIMMPRMNGIDVLRNLRKESELPVIMLTARGDDLDRIIGLELGADDYLAKPANPRELLARIRAILRRSSAHSTVATLGVGDLSLNQTRRELHRNDEFGQLARDMDEMAARLQVSQQANRRLLRDVSHELRSPLARLRVALEIARNKDQSLVIDELNRIELESERLEQLIDEVLGLLRESSGTQEMKTFRFDLAELLHDLVETVNYEISEDSQQIVLQQPSSMMLEADRELLWRAFENLLRNAIIHSGNSERIQISAKRVSEKEIQISVTDSGPGISEAHIGRVFEPFYRVDEARNRSSGGHGLGLAIAASAIRRHGGTISASNRQQGGLEVRVTLPVAGSG